MAKEEFLLSVRTAARLLPPPNVATDSPCIDPATLARRIHKADLWLTPRSIEGFDAQDFGDLASNERDELSQAVRQFRAVAEQVPGTAPATDTQRQAALRELARITSILRPYVMRDAMREIEGLLQNAEQWSKNKGWAVLRDTKQLEEGFIGRFEAPVLLIHTPQGRLLLDPVARFVVGGMGLAELAVMPSFDSTRILRREDGWYILPENHEGTPEKWSETSFVSTVQRMIAAQ